VVVRVLSEALPEAPGEADGRPIEEVLAELAKDVPEAEWKRLPLDLTDDLDHHLYGTPRK
jgi:hypothetical protein